jgi:transketolase
MTDVALKHSSVAMAPVVAGLLADLGDQLPDLMVLAADGRALATPFAKRHPERFIDVGIAESNLVGVAAGLARAGHRVVVCGMAPFLVRRAAEQLRIDVCRPGLNVTVLGVGGGLGYGTLGATHHVTEDAGAFAVMPGTRVYCPADIHDAAWAVRDAVLGSGPGYVRLGAREDEVVYPAGTAFSGGEPQSFGAPGDALAVATGGTVAHAIRAAEHARRQGLQVQVLGLTQVFPFPAAAVLRAAAGARTVVTAEEHYAQGGLGSHAALAMVGRWHGRFRALAVDGRPAPTQNRPGLFRFFGIDSSAIADALLDNPTPVGGI